MRRHLVPGFVCALIFACGETEAPAPAAVEPGGESAPPAADEAGPPPPALVEPAASERVAESPPVVARPKPREISPPAPAEPRVPEAPAPAPGPAVDLDRLEEQLRDTNALGILTKLALKNEIDDLVEGMEKFHREGQGQLPLLQERFDLFVMKLMSLLQDDAPDLANEIAKSRDDLWELLADPREFARLST